MKKGWHNQGIEEMQKAENLVIDWENRCRRSAKEFDMTSSRGRAKELEMSKSSKLIEIIREPKNSKCISIVKEAKNSL